MANLQTNGKIWMALTDLDGVLLRVETHGKIHVQKTLWRSS